jgi:thiamine-phosphate pyrophosphorylase
MRKLPHGILPILDVGDSALVPLHRALEIARATFRGGAKTMQLRAKHLSDRSVLELAVPLCMLAQEYGASFFLNDRPDLAILAGADGVHLGQHDLPAKAVRAWLPEAMAIGVSCHSVQDADRALEEGVADYMGFGPVYATTTKLNPDPVVGHEGLSRAIERHPGATFVAIGGITVDRLRAVRETGVKCAAMISGLYGAEDVERQTRHAIEIFG